MKAPVLSSLRRLVLPVLLAAGLALPAGATWSIVAVNRRTGEVAVASCTCITNFDLQRFVPVVVVGTGAAAAQSAIDINARNRKLIYAELQKGTTPADILLLLSMRSGHQSRQYGIASMSGPAVTFTGNGAGKAKGGVCGDDGEISWAIQGNVLAGQAVYRLAESAFLDTPGDLGQRVLAGMEAARSLGGDGRCSCSSSKPASCGAPPPGFTKSAHVGFLIVARIGDTDGGCNSANGCALGSYYCDLDVIGGQNDPDPVDQLKELYGDWRAAHDGRPDALLSTVESELPSLPADGTTKTFVHVRLVDVDGVPIRHGGARLTVTPLDPVAAGMRVGPADDGDNGSYLFQLTAPLSPGVGHFGIKADDGVLTATLYPHLAVQVDPVIGLHLGAPVASVGGGTRVPFTLDLPGAAGEPFVLVGALAPTGGTGAGLGLGPLSLLPTGFLDGAGHARGALALPAALQVPGWQLSVQAVHPGGTTRPVELAQLPAPALAR